MHTYKWHTTTDANTQWHCEERTHMHLLHPVWHRVPPNSSIIYRPRHTRLFITNVFFLCTACLCEGRRQACSLCVAFAKPIKNLNVDWPVYHRGALSLVSFAFGVTDQQDFWLSGSISKTRVCTCVHVGPGKLLHTWCFFNRRCLQEQQCWHSYNKLTQILTNTKHDFIFSGCLWSYSSEQNIWQVTS